MPTDMFSNIFLKWLLGNHTWFTPKLSLENVGKRLSALDPKKLQLYDTDTRIISWDYLTIIKHPLGLGSDEGPKD